eukprot:110305-Hanusia_phi.AAC.3
MERQRRRDMEGGRGRGGSVTGHIAHRTCRCGWQVSRASFHFLAALYLSMLAENRSTCHSRQGPSSALRHVHLPAHLRGGEHETCAPLGYEASPTIGQATPEEEEHHDDQARYEPLTFPVRVDPDSPPEQYPVRVKDAAAHADAELIV